MVAYKLLGKTGLLVSDICLGAMTFGDPGPWNIPTETDDANVFEIFDAFVNKGYNFIDTANVYGAGSSEQTVGRWLKHYTSTKPGASRDDIVIATKGFGAIGKGPNDKGLSRKHLVKALEGSLERLDTPYIDLYQCHGFDQVTPIKETLLTLHDFVRAGKVRYVGASNWSAWQLQKAIDLSESLQIEPFVSLQQQYSLLERNLELDIVDVCKNEGVSILPWSPLKGGWLAGKYSRPKEDEKHTVEGRIAWAEKLGWTETAYKPYANETTWSLLDVISDIATSKSVPISAVSLRYLIQKPTVASTIIGARTLKQLEENLIAGEITLTPEEVKRLDDASALEKFYGKIPYPYNIQQSQAERNGRLKSSFE